MTGVRHKKRLTRRAVCSIIPSRMNKEMALERLKIAKQAHSYFTLSKQLDVPVTTIYRWLKSGRMHRMSIELVLRKLKP